MTEKELNSNEKELSFSETYEVPIVLVVNNFSVEYAGCGTHQIEIKAEAELEKLQELYQALGGIKGINR